MAAAEPMRTLTAQCHCKSLHFTIEVPQSALPLATHLCHCSICRYTHGTLCIFHAPLPKGVAPRFVSPSSLQEHATAYRAPGSQCLRYFCSTCGCHVGDVGIDDGGEWVVSTSVFAAVDQDAFLIRSHVFADSAPGQGGARGGLTRWLSRIGDRDMGIWNPGPEYPAIIPVPEPPRPAPGEGGTDRVRAQCHCGGVSMAFPRPTPDVLADPDLRKFVSPVEKGKWLACLDACDDCRLVSGAHVIAWTFLPRRVLDPEPQGPELQVGTSRAYRSSAAAMRTFCSVCGAVVFYARTGDEAGSGRGGGDDPHRQVVDLALGLVRACSSGGEDGRDGGDGDGDVLAEDWVTWRAGRLAFHDSGARFNQELAEGLRDGLATWGLGKYGRSLDFEIG